MVNEEKRLESLIHRFWGKAENPDQVKLRNLILNFRNQDGRNMLHLIAIHGADQLVRRVVEEYKAAKISLDLEDYHGYNAVELACIYPGKKGLENTGSMAAMIASLISSRLTIVQELTENGSEWKNKESKKTNQETVLYWAVVNGDWALALYLENQLSSLSILF